jgi:hypothetical protein
VFLPFEFEEDMKRIANVGTFAKNVFTCLEHIKKYKIYKEIKEVLIKLYSGEIQIDLSGKNNKGTMSLEDFEKCKKHIRAL